MAAGKPWSRDDLLVAMHLYCQMPFGQFHSKNRTVIATAGAMGRTPSSLAMKLCNLASLDPAHQARGVAGLSGASQADREVWAAFQANWEGMATASAAAVEALGVAGSSNGVALRISSLHAPRVRVLGLPGVPPPRPDSLHILPCRIEIDDSAGAQVADDLGMNMADGGLPDQDMVHGGEEAGRVHAPRRTSLVRRCGRILFGLVRRQGVGFQPAGNGPGDGEPGHDGVNFLNQQHLRSAVPAFERGNRLHLALGMRPTTTLLSPFSAP